EDRDRRATPWSQRRPAIAIDAEKPRRSLAENGAALGDRERRVLDHLHRVGIADREGKIRAEADLVGARYIAEIAQRARLEQNRIEIEPPELGLGVGEFAFVDRVV